MRIPRPALAVLTALALTVTACGSDATPEQTADGQSAVVLRAGSASVSTFDYAKSNAGYAQIGGLVLEPLLVFDDAGQLSPWLAESWEETDPTTYVYHLREGVKFTSGNELTADDVVFSYDHYRADGSANGYNFPDALDSVTATDKHTVTVKLSTPDAAWQFVPAGSPMGVFEKAFFEANSDTYGQPGTGVVGTGPWKLDSFNPTSGAQLTANADYWGEKPAIDKIEWTFYASETNSALAFRAGEVDLVMPSDSTAFATAADTEMLRVAGVNRTGMFRMNVLQAPWDDVHVRRAVAHALNKEDLIKAGGVYATPLDTFIPPVMLRAFGSEQEVTAALADVPTYPYDLDKAKQEMAQSQYPDGAEATIMTTGEGAPVKISQAVVAQLAKIGIKVTIEAMTSESSTALKLGADRTAIISAFDTYGGIGLDPGRAFDYAIGSRNAAEGGWNTSGFATERADELIAKGFATLDPAERLKVYADLLQEFGENVPFVPVYLTDVSIALSDNFEWPDFSAYWNISGPWALNLKASSE